MPSVKPLTNILNKWAKYYKDETANFFIITGVIGFASSCLCQTAALLLNKKVPPREKKFLVPQELTDGAVNIAIFLAITSKFRKEAGEIAKKKFANLLNNESHLAVEKFSKMVSIKERASWDNEQKKAWDVLINVRKNNTKIDPEDAVVKNSDYVNGIQVLAYLVGQIVACNFVSPFVRNKIGALYQGNSTKSKIAPPQKQFKVETKNKPYTNISSYLNRTQSAGPLKI